MAARSVHAPAKVPPSVLTQVVGVVALALGASLLSVTVKTMVAASAVDEIPAHESSSKEKRHFAARHLRKNADRKSTRLNSSHLVISYAVFCLKKKKKKNIHLNRQR